MKLDRNIEGNEGRGKYAILQLRRLETFMDDKAFGGLPPDIGGAIETLEQAGILEWGNIGTEHEFFLIKLKDMYSPAALKAYADKVGLYDSEFAKEVLEMLNRAGQRSKWCKVPD